MNAVKQAEQRISEHDKQDALRLVETAVTLAALPGMASQAARELAVTRIRALMSNHPRSAEVLAAIVTHIESY